MCKLWYSLFYNRLNDFFVGGRWAFEEAKGNWMVWLLWWLVGSVTLNYDCAKFWFGYCFYRFIEGDFDTYLTRIQQPYVWGGEPELLMASHVLKWVWESFFVNSDHFSYIYQASKPMSSSSMVNKTLHILK